MTIQGNSEVFGGSQPLAIRIRPSESVESLGSLSQDAHIETTHVADEEEEKSNVIPNNKITVAQTISLG